MPDWSRPHDVAFDFGTANTLLDQITATLFATETWIAAFDATAHGVEHRWTGRLADQYTIDAQRWRYELATIADDLRTLASLTHRSAADARAAMARVAAIQDQWDAELRAELAMPGGPH